MTTILLGGIGLLAFCFALVRLIVWIMDEIDDTDWI